MLGQYFVYYRTKVIFLHFLLRLVVLFENYRIILMRHVVLFYLLQKNFFLNLLILTLALLFKSPFHDFEVTEVTKVIRELCLNELLEVIVGEAIRRDKLIDWLIQVHEKFVFFRNHIQLGFVNSELANALVFQLAA